MRTARVLPNFMTRQAAQQRARCSRGAWDGHVSAEGPIAGMLRCIGQSHPCRRDSDSSKPPLPRTHNMGKAPVPGVRACCVPWGGGEPAQRSRRMPEPLVASCRRDRDPTHRHPRRKPTTRERELLCRSLGMVGACRTQGGAARSCCEKQPRVASPAWAGPACLDAPPAGTRLAGESNGVEDSQQAAGSQAPGTLARNALPVRLALAPCWAHRAGAGSRGLALARSRGTCPYAWSALVGPAGPYLSSAKAARVGTRRVHTQMRRAQNSAGAWPARAMRRTAAPPHRRRAASSRQGDSCMRHHRSTRPWRHSQNSLLACGSGIVRRGERHSCQGALVRASLAIASQPMQVEVHQGPPQSKLSAQAVQPGGKRALSKDARCGCGRSAKPGTATIAVGIGCQSGNGHFVAFDFETLRPR